MATMLENGLTPSELARDAFRELLAERPDFMETAQHSINDVVPFLEQENGFPKWLGYFENNMRALSAIWIQTAKQMKASSALQAVAAKPLQNSPKPLENSRPQPGVRPLPDIQRTPQPGVNRIADSLRPLQEAAKPSQEPPKPVQETSTPTLETSKPAQEAKPKTTTPKKPKETAEGVVENKTAIVPREEIPPAMLEEQAFVQSKALAEQFAIVKHHEIALRQAAISIEEATEALNRARQAHGNAITAYNNALEDLARMLTSSLGAKATEFSKLMAKVATSGGGDTTKK
jgi:hypothetical protein